jgi:hypothetical protein
MEKKIVEQLPFNDKKIMGEKAFFEGRNVLGNLTPNFFFSS